MRSVAAACAEAGVALLGGETAEHPGVMEADAFDLAGAALGIVEEGEHVDGSAIRPGDTIVGLASPNLRANGFSLVRRVVLEELELDDVLLEPSVLYTPAMTTVLDELMVKGMAHITGGGLPGNVARILPDFCNARIDTDEWLPPPVFAAVRRLGDVPSTEMFRTFNMGIGFVVVVSPAMARDVIAIAEAAGHQAGEIGAITPGAGRVVLE
ncbi:MAG: hypothetical protein GWO22_39615 [Actinobacteria bacterium]|nr:hypothetical protein [Actinomycetota bacterium]NIT98972.1 hypothetical protein [Actinomycetota bacterium]NIV59172.1 hypothetical protein [Actinomycetota bacterium]NIX53948.1 hypothetical protein [Actinomycetota bacterium]